MPKAAYLDVLRAATRGLGTGDIEKPSASTARPSYVGSKLADEGLVEWPGKSKRDPRAFWTIKLE
jgi:hypothetical protein